MEKFRILYKGNLVRVKSIRYDYKSKTNVFILDNNDGTMIDIITNEEVYDIPDEFATNQQLSVKELKKKIIKQIEKNKIKLEQRLSILENKN